VSDASGIVVQQIRVNYATNNVTTATWFELDSALDEHARHAEILDTGGATMKLGIGAASSEVDLVHVIPGGNGLIPLKLSKGQRLAVKAVSANVTTGELTINLHY